MAVHREAVRSADLAAAEVGADSVAAAVVLAAVPAVAAVQGEVGDMYFTLVAAILCGIIILWYLLTYNSLVKARNAVDQAWSHIEVELKRRLDLITNLVEIAKGYAKHERDVFTQVAALRAQQSPFNSAAAANSAEPDMKQAIGNIMIMAENYPQLRADQNFLNLQKELTETEDRIAERRHAYNETVNKYLNLIRSVPSNIVAYVQEMAERSFFDVPDADVARAPEIKLT
jgi:LemA protein